MTVVAVVVCLHSWRMTHQGGVRPIMAQMGVDRRSIRVIRSVLECRALVLFTPDTTHCQACRKEKENLINNGFGCLYLFKKFVLSVTFLKIFAALRLLLMT